MKVEHTSALVDILHFGKSEQLNQGLAIHLGIELSQAFARCCEVVRRCQTVLVEHQYYDPDYRSEFIFHHSSSFRPQTRHTKRLHFFARSDIKRHELQSLQTDDYGYLGYLTLRPSPTNHVGRTMLEVPKKLDGVYIRDCVRTAVREPVHVFGAELMVKAVPFMEQDGVITRCAHAVTWMTHYTAVLRGLVSRRSIAEFHIEGERHGISPTRGFPSSGLLNLQIANILGSLDLPPETYAITGFDQPGDLAASWHSRKALVNGSPEEWFYERFTGELCRYLNSSLPVAILQRDHAFVACGYERSSFNGDEPRPVQNLVVHDDVRGPYRVEPIPTYADLLAGKWRFMLVPLPHETLMTAQDAEQLASAWIESVLAALPKSVPLRDLRQKIVDRDIALRCYATPSRYFKSASEERLKCDPIVRDWLKIGRMSKYIWVVEMVDRGRRLSSNELERRNSVIGEVVIDASSTRMNPNILAVHLPGFFVGGTELTGEPNGLSFSCDDGAKYESGRPAFDDPEPFDVMSLAKAAIPGGKVIGSFR